MSTFIYRNAIILFGATQLHGALNTFNVEFAAEMQDETTFGDDTRVNKGGLFTVGMSGSGFFDPALGVEEALFPDVGDDDTIVVVFPDGITEGGTTTGMGYAMKGVIENYNLGGSVGDLLGVDFAVQGRGIEA